MEAARLFGNAAAVFEATAERELRLAAHFETLKDTAGIVECLKAFAGAKQDAEAAGRKAAEFLAYAKTIRPSAGAVAWMNGMREFTEGFKKLPTLTGRFW
jgi:hypothetical protein